MGADMNFTMTINGKAVTGAEKFGVENPALGEVFAEAPNCTQAELDEARALDELHQGAQLDQLLQAISFRGSAGQHCVTLVDPHW